MRACGLRRRRRCWGPRCRSAQPELQELPSLRHRLAAMNGPVWNPGTGRTFADFAERLRASDAALSLLTP